MGDVRIKSTSIDGIVMRHDSVSSAPSSVQPPHIDNERNLPSKPVNNKGFSTWFIVLSLLILAIVGFILWKANNDTVIKHKSVTIDVSQPFVQDENSFGVKIFSALAFGGLKNNLLISPISLNSSLALLDNGLSGSNQQLLLSQLGLGAFSRDSINSSSQALLASLRSPEPKIMLSLVSGLWVNNKYKVKKSFASLVSSDYYTSVNYFNQAEGLNIANVNQWLASRGITLPLSSFQSSVSNSLDLISSANLKADWYDAFNPSLIVNSDFNNLSEQPVKVPFMYQTGVYPYFQNSLVQSIELPMGKNQQFSMDIFLPADVKSFVNTLSYHSLNSIASQYTSQTGSIRLPEFSIDDQQNLANLLGKLGMGSLLLSKQVNLSNIASGLNLSSLVHSAAISINYQGVNPVGNNSTVGSGFSMNLNRPFLFTVIDNSTKYILFVGMVNNLN